LILNRKVCFVFIDPRAIKFSLPDKITISLPRRNFLLFLWNHWQDNFQNLLNHIKSRSSLPQVGCARGANTFSSHNQSLTHESLTKTSTSGFPSNPESNTRWRLPKNKQTKKKVIDVARGRAKIILIVIFFALDFLKIPFFSILFLTLS
jgi:hypothetical protein